MGSTLEVVEVNGIRGISVFLAESFNPRFLPSSQGFLEDLLQGDLL